MNYPYRLVDKRGVVHVADPDNEHGVYVRCERDERGYLRPLFFGEGALTIVGDTPSCLWCVVR